MNPMGNPTEEILVDSGASIPPEAMMHFPPVSDFPLFLDNFGLSVKFQKFPVFPKIISIFIRLTTFFLFIDHKFWIFPPILPVLQHFPPDSRKFRISSVSKISPLFSKNSTAFYILYVYFCPPTLTMMHLCITQCTYWTPLSTCTTICLISRTKIM